MKYEPVFGDQSLFDGAPEDAEMAASVCQMPRWYTMFDGKVLFCDSKKESWQSADFNHPGSQLLAMRRIIRTPTWTIADQTAGKLPEVGCRVSFCHKFNTNWRAGEIKYIDDLVAFIKTDDIDRPFIYEVDRVEFKPIESPEEKAARLRDEWVEKAVGATPVYEIATHGYSTQLRIDISSIYDAMISGDLPVPVKGE